MDDDQLTGAGAPADEPAVDAPAADPLAAPEADPMADGQMPSAEELPVSPEEGTEEGDSTLSL